MSFTIELCARVGLPAISLAPDLIRGCQEQVYQAVVGVQFIEPGCHSESQSGEESLSVRGIRNTIYEMDYLVTQSK